MDNKKLVPRDELFAMMARTSIFKNDQDVFISHWMLPDKDVYNESETEDVFDMICLVQAILLVRHSLGLDYHEYTVIKMGDMHYVDMDDVIGNGMLPFPYALFRIYGDGIFDVTYTFKKSGKQYFSYKGLEVLRNFADYIKTNPFKRNNAPDPGILTYIMYDESTGYHKIGRSKNPKYRECTLQSKKPTIKLVLITPDNIEHELHTEFKSKRIRGEWFNLNADDILYLIEEYSFKKPE